MKRILAHNRIIFLLFLMIAVSLTACGNDHAEKTAEYPYDSSEKSVPYPESFTEGQSSLNRLKISEAMPSNKDCLFDEDGDSSDWLELVNLGEAPVSLQNCWLSNDAGEPDLWQLPDLVLDSGERILIFCSGKDRTEGELHTNFTLSKSGGVICLSSSFSVLDTVHYPAAEKDAAVLFLSDADQPLEKEIITGHATPGYPNNEDGYEEYLSRYDQHGALVINEAVSYNQSFPEKPGKYYDWIELKNSSAEPLSLKDYYLSDQDSDLQKTQLPDIILSPGETYIVYCSGDEQLSSGPFFHAGFAVGAEDRLYVTDSSGLFSDRLYLHDVPLYGSVGRMDHQSGFWYFAEPSPGKENLGGFRSITRAPEASVAQGVYNDLESLEIELTGAGTIYYTLDGSIPDPSDREYDGPISIKKTAVLRAVCVEDGKLTGYPATFSYILNEHDTIPVTSLVCEPKDMFGYGGVYTAARLLDAKCDASVSFFDSNGDGFSAECSAELHGAHSRTVFKKKSFELKFSSRYGGDVEYDLFGDGIRTRFSTLLLRGGSSVNLDTVRDCFASKLMLEFCPWLYPQNTRYTAVYLNGEYYGIYAWREAYSEQYFADHTGMTEDGIQMVRGPVSGGDLLRLLNDIGSHTMSSSSQYEDAARQFDMDSLAGWMAIQSYFDNQDINGNIRYVRLSDTSKWQLIAYDLDYSCLTSTTGWGTVLSSYQLGSVCRSLLANDAFRQLLLETCAELYQSGFQTERILESYDELLAPLDEDSVRKDCLRWNDDYLKWLKNTKAMRNHLSDSRMVNWLAGLKTLTKASDEQMHLYFPEYY